MFNQNKKRNGVKKMDHSKNTKKQNSRAVSSVNMVSEGTEIIGTLKTTSDIRIAGKIDGEAEVEGKIIIASTGHIDGNINSKDADVAGRIEGEVHVTSKLILRQSAVVEGDLYAQSLVVEEGATFNGACHMRDYTAKQESAAGKGSSHSSQEGETVVA